MMMMMTMMMMANSFKIGEEEESEKHATQAEACLGFAHRARAVRAGGR
jgi:hypothetical protein